MHFSSNPSCSSSIQSGTELELPSMSLSSALPDALTSPRRNADILLDICAISLARESARENRALREIMREDASLVADPDVGAGREE